MNIQHLKLHHYPAARSARARWMLHEVVGSNFEVERVALYDGAQYSDEYLWLKPNLDAAVAADLKELGYGS
jgi:glutathione S-transferase